MQKCKIVFLLVRSDLGWDEEHSVILKQSMNFQFVCEMKGNTAYCTLSQVNIYQKPDTRKSLFATPPLYLSHLLLMFGQKQTEMEPMQGEHTEGPVYIELPAVLLVPFTAVQGVPLCPVTVGSTDWPQTWHVWPSLSSSFFASPCSTSAPAVCLAPGRLCHPVSLEVTVHIVHK